MISISMNVTKCLRAQPHCHHNFGYGSRNRMIPCAKMPDHIGPRVALESKLVYS
jgi:hypothetical protein